MPIYKITQQQGNRVITSTLEAKSVSDLIAFLDAVSTAEIKYIYKVEFETQKTNFPSDDFNYNKQFKAFVSNKNRMCKQILIHNVKKTKNEAEISALIKTHLEVGGLAVKGVSCSLFICQMLKHLNLFVKIILMLLWLLVVLILRGLFVMSIILFMMIKNWLKLKTF